MNLLRTVVLVCAMIVAGPALAADLVTKKSPHTVAATLDRLEKVLTSKGIIIAARIDHAANAKSVGADLPPTALLVFGNPRLGTKLMMVNREIALDLPMKVLAWQDDGGQVWLGYRKPASLAADHGIAQDHEVVKTMTGALDKLTDAALKP